MLPVTWQMYHYSLIFCWSPSNVIFFFLQVATWMKSFFLSIAFWKPKNWANFAVTENSSILFALATSISKKLSRVAKCNFSAPFLF